MKLLIGDDGFAGENGVIARGKTLLLRDINDRHYPYRGEYPDFDQKRRWEEHDATHITPRGVYFKRREWYAYVDREKKLWDFAEAVDLTPRRHNLDQANQRRLEDEGRRVEYFWRHLPRSNRGKLIVHGFLAFEDILIVDDKGDPEYSNPHLFVDFGERGPFSHMTAMLTSSYRDPIYSGKLDAEFKRTPLFPKKFPEPKRGKRHDPAELNITSGNLRTLTNLHGAQMLYGFDNGLAELQVGDLIRIPKEEGSTLETYAEVTHRFEVLETEYRVEHGDWEANRLKEFAGRELQAKDRITIYEIARLIEIGEQLSYSHENEY